MSKSETYKVVVSDSSGNIYKELVEGEYELCTDFIRWAFESGQAQQLHVGLELSILSNQTGRFVSHVVEYEVEV